MFERNHLILEFDAVKEIFHFSSREKISIDSHDDLNTLCRIVNDFLNKSCNGQRCYMIVDISRINISPDLANKYQEKVADLFHRYLYPDGLVRYGYGITRITARKASMKSSDDNAILFANYREAVAYIENLIIGGAAPGPSKTRTTK